MALARAVVIRPPVLLCDEPLGALDRKLRQAMQMELKELQRELGVTLLFVTHDQEEALAMSDRIGVMHAGRLEQVDTPSGIYDRPASRFVAEFIGDINLFDVVLDGNARNGAGRALPAPPGAAGRHVLAVRPERMRLVPPGQGCLDGRVRDTSFIGDQVVWLIDVDGQRLTVKDRARPNGATIGDAVSLDWIAGDAVLLPVRPA